MKRTALFSLFILLLSIILPACKEDIYIDWKLLNEKAMADTVKKYKVDTTFFSTASGLSYKVIHQGGGHKIDAGSYITVSYTGKLIDGSVFDSIYKKNLGQVGSLVPGFREAVKKMNVGGKYIFYIPSPLGYDTVTTNSRIPAYSNLIFEVTLDGTY